MKRRSDSPEAKRKAKLKLRYWDSLNAELNRTMERALLLAELVCEKRAKDSRARMDAMPKPCHLPVRSMPKPVLPRVPRMNDWGLVS